MTGTVLIALAEAQEIECVPLGNDGHIGLNISAREAVRCALPFSGSRRGAYLLAAGVRQILAQQSGREFDGHRTTLRPPSLVMSDSMPSLRTTIMSSTCRPAQPSS